MKACMQVEFGRRLLTSVALLAGAASMAQAEPVAGPWLRVYPEYVQGVFIDADSPGELPPSQMASVVIALSTVHTGQARVAQTRLASFATDAESQARGGCLFNHLDAPYGTPTSRNECDRLERAAFTQLADRRRACAARRSSSDEVYLFVAQGLKTSKCLVAHNTWRADAAPTPEPGIWIKSQLEIENRFQGSVGIRESEVHGQFAYMQVHKYKAFGCYKLGTPTTYRSKRLPENLARVTLEQLRMSLPPARYEEALRDPSQIFFEPPTWQKQYLVRTSGFRYHCWDAKRTVDQPEAVGLLLDDGTALLWGTVSVLRVRLADGGTGADESNVRVLDAAVVSRWMDQLTAQGECPDKRCSLAVVGGYEAVQQTASAARARIEDQAYYRYVLQGVDKSLRKQFFQSNN